MSSLRDKPDGMAQEVYEGIVVAQRLRTELGLGASEPVDCLLELAERRLGTEVVVAPLSGGVSGFYLPARPVPLIVVEQSHPVQRQRFTIAHELGHHALGHAAAPRIHSEPVGSGGDSVIDGEKTPHNEPAGPAEPDTPAATSDGASAPIPANLTSHFTPFRAPNAEERAANVFAAELLIPRSGSARLLAGWSAQSLLDRAVRLSSHFGVSAFSAVVRLQTLEVIDRAGAGVLRRELAGGAHLPRYEELGLRLLDDALQRHATAGGPRCSRAARLTLSWLRAEADAAV